MSKKVCFIGHRDILFNQEIKNRLRFAIQNEIDCGCKHFVVGTHGDFDRMALGACRDFRKLYKDVEIEVIITSLNTIKKEIFKDEFFEDEIITPYADVITTMYPIEEEYFKSQILVSNRQMIDSCDVLICFVDENRRRSGAKTALKYAKKHGLKITNIF